MSQYSIVFPLTYLYGSTEFKEILTPCEHLRNGAPGRGPLQQPWDSLRGTNEECLKMLEACHFATQCHPMLLLKHVVTSQTSPWDWNTSAFVDAASVRSEKNDSVMHERSAFRRWCHLHLLLARGLKHQTSFRDQCGPIDRYDDTFHRTHWPWPWCRVSFDLAGVSSRNRMSRDLPDDQKTRWTMWLEDQLQNNSRSLHYFVGKETTGRFVTHYVLTPKHCKPQAKLVTRQYHSYIAGS